MIKIFCIIYLWAHVQCTNSSIKEIFYIEGRIISPLNLILPFNINTIRISVNGGQQIAFPRQNGSFVITNIAPGSYHIEVYTPNYIYDSVRVDVSQRGNIRARKINLIQPSQAASVPYPLQLKSHGIHQYFQIREQWKIADFIFNPMILMMVVSLLLVMVLPQMVSDPATRKEMEHLKMPKYDMPELSEMVTNLFGASTDKGKKTIMSKNKKRN